MRCRSTGSISGAGYACLPWPRRALFHDDEGGALSPGNYVTLYAGIYRKMLALKDPIVACYSYVHT